MVSKALQKSLYKLKEEQEMIAEGNWILRLDDTNDEVTEVMNFDL